VSLSLLLYEVILMWVWSVSCWLVSECATRHKGELVCGWIVIIKRKPIPTRVHESCHDPLGTKW